MENQNQVATTAKMTGQPKTKLMMNLSSPEDVMEFSLLLKKFIKDNKLSTEIQGKQYVQVDGWKFAGINFGIIPIVEQPVKDKSETVSNVFYQKRKIKNYKNEWIDKDVPVLIAGKDVTHAIKEDQEWTKTYTKVTIMPVYKYSCECSLVRMSDGVKVGYGSAICSNSELLKISFDEYAVSSMAQTRAISKAFRNLLGFIMQAAGFETTPAEEMEEKYAKKPEENTDELTDIEFQLTLLNTVEELGKYFEQESMKKHRSDPKVIALFHARKVQIVKPVKKETK